MLIWDEKKKEHIVRIIGLEKARVRKADFSLVSTNTADEAKIRTKIDSKLSNHHTYIHIFDKPTNLTPTNKLNYLMWIGPIGTEPRILPGCNYWWEQAEVK